MTTQPKSSLRQLVLWVGVEVMLSWAGLDGLADYSEFVFNRSTHEVLQSQSSIVCAIVLQESISVKASPLIQPS